MILHQITSVRTRPKPAPDLAPLPTCPRHGPTEPPQPTFGPTVLAASRITWASAVPPVALMADTNVVPFPAASWAYQPRTDRAMSTTPATWSSPATTPALASWPILGRTWFAPRMRQLTLDSPHKASDTENEHERPALPTPIHACNEDGYTRPVRFSPWGTTQRPYGVRQCDRNESNYHSNAPPWVPPFHTTTGLHGAPWHN